MTMKPANRDSLYGRRWKRARADFLTRRPLCRMCDAQGRVTAASVVNHNPPHGYDPERFWDQSTWEPLCKMHHDSTQQSFEKTGRMPGCDADGTPVDPDHPWAAQGRPTYRRGQRWGYSIPDGIRRSAVPVHLVCGPPGSGKSTYARAHAKPGDTIIDMDDIKAGLGFHRYTDNPKELRLARHDRAMRLHALAYRAEGEAWLVIMAPTDHERQQWHRALGGVTVHAMDTAPGECKRRIRADPEREGHRQRLLSAVDEYFQSRAHSATQRPTQTKQVLNEP